MQPEMNVFTEAAGRPTEYADTSFDGWSYMRGDQNDGTVDYGLMPFSVGL